MNNETPSYYVNKGLSVYKEVAEIASKEGVQIIVYPEDGLFVAEDKQDALNYAEHIPNPEDAVVPCTDARYDAGGELASPGILKTLSCLAKDNNLYLVANIADLVPCDASKDASKDAKCPKEGHYLYNTAVAFDPEGTLVLKYHKYHLFGEFQYDVPSYQQHAVLKTPFGDFGVYTCFDKIFKNPAIALVEDAKLKNIVLTTWWFDETPFLSASQIHSSYAAFNQINFLVSNAKRLKTGTTGSGVYSADKVIAYHHDTESDGRPTLIIADVPVTPGKVGRCKSAPKTFHLDYAKDADAYHRTQVPIANFKHAILSFSADAEGYFYEKVCNGTLCCAVNGKFRDGPSTNQKFMLGVSNKIRSGYQDTGFKWCEEACVLVALDANWRDSGLMASVSETMFETLTIKGTGFSTDYVFPSVLTSHQRLITNKEWSVERYPIDKQFGKRVKLSVQSKKNILTASLYGRCYDKDPDYVREHYGRTPTAVSDF